MLISICKRIYNNMAIISEYNESQCDALERVYRKTWTIVRLVQEGLVDPTNAARDRIVDLDKVVANELQKAIEADIRSKIFAGQSDPRLTRPRPHPHRT